MIKKIMLLGEIGVGKTSIARRLSLNAFGESYKATIGVDIYRYDVVPPPGKEPFTFLVWDTDGSYGEAIFQHIYFREAHAAVIVSDATRPSTIDSMLRLGQHFMDTLPGRYLAHVVNKVDLLDDGLPAELCRATGGYPRAVHADQRQNRRERRDTVRECGQPTSSTSGSEPTMPPLERSGSTRPPSS